MRFYFYLFLLTNTLIMAQDKLPMSEIPPPPSTLKAGDIISRMIQGLGYRFYWASKDLGAEERGRFFIGNFTTHLRALIDDFKCLYFDSQQTRFKLSLGGL
jgi:hypothetical protein